MFEQVFFVEKGQQVFFDLRVFGSNACWYLNKSLHHCDVINTNEKKRVYNERVLQADHGTLTSLGFSIYGSMGRKCHKVYYQICYQKNVIYESQ